MVERVFGSRGPSKFLWSVLPLLVVLSFALVACGGESTPASSTQMNTSQSSGSSQSSASGNAITVTITEKTGTHDIYSFDPATVTAKVGDTIKWVNQSDENHQLVLSNGQGSLFDSTSVVPKNGNYEMTVKTAGTYSYSSKLVNRTGADKQNEGMSSSAEGSITVS